MNIANIRVVWNKMNNEERDALLLAALSMPHKGTTDEEFDQHCHSIQAIYRKYENLLTCSEAEIVDHIKPSLILPT